MKLLTLFLLSFLSVHSHELSWSDYKATAPKDQLNVLARTYVSLRLEVTDSGGYFSFKVWSEINKSLSWTRTGSPDVLRHELTHLKIGQLCADLCMKQMPVLDNNHKKGERIYKDWFRKMSKMQDEFDDQTKHGNDLLVELKLEAEIDVQLKSPKQH